MYYRDMFEPEVKDRIRVLERFSTTRLDPEELEIGQILVVCGKNKDEDVAVNTTGSKEPWEINKWIKRVDFNKIQRVSPISEYKIGEQVEICYESNWLAGIICNLDPLMGIFPGMEVAENITVDQIRKIKTKEVDYKIGEEVEVRLGNSWKAGFISSLEPLMVIFPGMDTATECTLDQIRRCNKAATQIPDENTKDESNVYTDHDYTNEADEVANHIPDENTEYASNFQTDKHDKISMIKKEKILQEKKNKENYDAEWDEKPEDATDLNYDWVKNSIILLVTIVVVYFIYQCLCTREIPPKKDSINDEQQNKLNEKVKMDEFLRNQNAEDTKEQEKLQLQEMENLQQKLMKEIVRTTDLSELQSIPREFVRYRDSHADYQTMYDEILEKVKKQENKLNNTLQIMEKFKQELIQKIDQTIDESLLSDIPNEFEKYHKSHENYQKMKNEIWDKMNEQRSKLESLEKEMENIKLQLMKKIELTTDSTELPSFPKEFVKYENKISHAKYKTMYNAILVKVENQEIELKNTMQKMKNDYELLMNSINVTQDPSELPSIQSFVSYQNSHVKYQEMYDDILNKVKTRKTELEKMEAECAEGIKNKENEISPDRTAEYNLLHNTFEGCENMAIFKLKLIQAITCRKQIAKYWNLVDDRFEKDAKTIWEEIKENQLRTPACSSTQGQIRETMVETEILPHIIKKIQDHKKAKLLKTIIE